MSNTLNSITILKNLYSDEELMNNLNTMIDSLSSQLLYDRLRRSFITDKLLQIQNSFYAKYVPAYCKMQLCEGLPINIQQTVINYLVTSETVYEFLSSRKDRAQNDYSAALISLTKAVELILNYAISKMQISFDKSLPSLVKSQIFDKTVQKSHLALGPCIICIKGCEDINVNINQNKHIHLEPKNEFVFTLNGQATTVTDAWGIDDVFSFEKLKLFKGLQITIDKERENISSETAMAFSDNSKLNKLLFIKSLEHLKDHYRNPIAHKDPIDDNKVIACRKILIEGEYILWILIYLISHSF